MLGYIKFVAVKTVYTSGENIKNNGERCSEADFFLAWVYSAKVPVLADLLDILGDDNLLHRLLKLCVEKSFVPGVLKGFWMLLVPALAAAKLIKPFLLSKNTL